MSVQNKIRKPLSVLTGLSGSGVSALPLPGQPKAVLTSAPPVVQSTTRHRLAVVETPCHCLYEIPLPLSMLEPFDTICEHGTRVQVYLKDSKPVADISMPDLAVCAFECGEVSR